MDDDIELLKKLEGVRRDLLIYISKVAKYYYYTFSVTKLLGDELYFEDEDLSPILKNNLSKLDRYMKSNNYLLLNDSQVSQIIPDIQTECTEMGQARVFDLLFTDLYSSGPYWERKFDRYNPPSPSS